MRHLMICFKSVRIVVALLTFQSSKRLGRSTTKMKAKKFVMVSMLVVLMGLVAGCHYGSDNDYSGWGYGRSSGSQRDAFRAGRAYERRQQTWGNSPYYDRWDRYGY